MWVIHGHTHDPGWWECLRDCSHGRLIVQAWSVLLPSQWPPSAACDPDEPQGFTHVLMNCPLVLWMEEAGVVSLSSDRGMLFRNEGMGWSGGDCHVLTSSVPMISKTLQFTEKEIYISNGDSKNRQDLFF